MATSDRLIIKFLYVFFDNVAIANVAMSILCIDMIGTKFQIQSDLSFYLGATGCFTKYYVPLNQTTVGRGSPYTRQGTVTSDPARIVLSSGGRTISGGTENRNKDASQA